MWRRPMAQATRPAAIEAGAVTPARATRGYPEPFAARVAGRERRALGDAFGLTNFGVNLTRLPPGGMSALRHTHMREDEFIYIIEGEPVLVTNAGETPLRPGMCAGFKAGSGDAHHLINRSGRDVVWRSATAIPEIPSSTRTTTSAERSPRMVTASSCIGTAPHTELPSFVETPILMARRRTLRVTLHYLRRGHAHRHIDAHQGFDADIGRFDPGGRDIDQCASDRNWRGGDEDHMVAFAADQDWSGHRQ